MKFLNIGNDFFAIDTIERVSSARVEREGKSTIYRFEILFKQGHATYVHVDPTDFVRLRKSVRDQLMGVNNEG